MPATDAFLAYQAGAGSIVLYKHAATVIYLLLTAFVLNLVVKNEQNA
jgi:hypothetical protein